MKDSYLSEITGDAKYRAFSESVLNTLSNTEKYDGLLPIKVMIRE